MVTQVKQPAIDLDEINFDDIEEAVDKLSALIQHNSHIENLIDLDEISDEEYQQIRLDQFKKIKKIVLNLTIDTGVHADIISGKVYEESKHVLEAIELQREYLELDCF